jgi:hypothetical protein
MSELSNLSDLGIVIGHSAIEGFPDVVPCAVLPFLSAADAANFTITNRHFCRHEIRSPVLSRITKLMISNVNQMDPNLGERFPSVRIISFGDAALPSELDHTCILQHDFIGRLIPFLGTFPSLVCVNFDECWKILLAILLQLPREDGREFNLIETGQPVASLVFVLCDAYASGALPASVRLEKTFCPFPHNGAGELCALCRRVVATFPVEHLIEVTVTPPRLLLTFHDVRAMFSTFGEAETEGREWPIEHETMLLFLARPGGRDALMNGYRALCRMRPNI